MFGKNIHRHPKYELWANTIYYQSGLIIGFNLSILQIINQRSNRPDLLNDFLVLKLSYMEIIFGFGIRTVICKIDRQSLFPLSSYINPSNCEMTVIDEAIHSRQLMAYCASCCIYVSLTRIMHYYLRLSRKDNRETHRKK